MITFDHVTFFYPNAATPALAEVTLTLPMGGFTLLVGPSGAGKSTLLRLINGLVPHFSGGRLQGSIRVQGLDPVVATPPIMSRQVGFVFQDPEAQFVMDQVEDELAFALEDAGLPPQEMRLRVEEVLDLLELAPLRARALATLSGGERQRVAIAAALALRPTILVLDEPTSQLDPKSAEDVLNALVRLNSDLGLTIVLAEHRLERVLPFADFLVYLPSSSELLAGGELLAGDPRTVLSRLDMGPPLVQLGKALGWTPLPLTIKEALHFSRAMPITAAQPGRNRELPTPREPVLHVQKLTVHYQRQPVLQGVDFTLVAGEVVVLMGRNGAGKSTLLRSIVGLVRPQGGRITLQGHNLIGQDPAVICRTVGYLPQDPNALLFADSVREELLITLRNHGLATTAEGQTLLTTLLDQLGLADKAAHYPRDLSAGERQRTALAAILVTRPRVLLLDEPTRGLDAVAKQRLVELLHTWRRDGIAILLVTHDVELAAALADRVLLMSQGEIIAAGSPHTVLSASPLFAPQMARLFPGVGWLTVADVIQAKQA